MSPGHAGELAEGGDVIDTGPGRLPLAELLGADRPGRTGRYSPTLEGAGGAQFVRMFSPSRAYTLFIFGLLGLFGLPPWSEARIR